MSIRFDAAGSAQARQGADMPPVVALAGPDAPRTSNQGHTPAADHADRGFLGDVARWTVDHVGTIGAVLGTVGLIAAIPLAHSPVAAAEAGAAAGMTMRSRLASRIATTRLGSASVDAARSGAASLRAAVRSTATGSSALDGAARGWTRLRVAREALGTTPLGRALLRLQQPLYVAGAAIGAVNLSHDAYDWTQGRGSIRRTLLDSLAVLPAAGDIVKRVARARAAATEARAATEVASALGAAREHTASALATAGRADGAAPMVRTIASASSRAGAASANASRTAGEIGSEARILAPANDVAVPLAGTFVVRDLKRTVEAVEETTAHARDLAAGASVGAPEIRTTLETALRSTAHARRVLDDAATTSVRLTTTARGAERLQGVAANTSMTAGLANNTATFSTASAAGQHDAAHTSAQGIGRTLLGRVLAFNAGAGKAS